jgi:FkbM family methyltransferase
VAWEPNQACHRLLRAELAKVGGELLPYAAAPFNGTGSLVYPDRWGWIWGRKGDNVQVRPHKRGRIECRNLTEWLAAQPETEIILKLDAEGAEWGVIEELLKTPQIRLKRAFIEWHPWLGLQEGRSMRDMVAIQEGLRGRCKVGDWR